MNPRKWLRNQIRALHLAWLGRHGPDCSPRNWVFVVGCYNSGTTLLHEMLASHPDVARLPREGQYCTDQLCIPSTVGLTRAWALRPELFIPGQQQEIDFKRLKRQWCAAMRPAQAPIYLEKSIPNAGRISWLNTHFPNSRFIALVRNGYAVAEGIRRKAGLPIDLAAKQWAEANRIMLEQLQGTTHYLLSYETLTAAPGAAMTKLFRFLDLPADGFPEDKVWTVHGNSAPVQNMNAPALQRLSPADRDLIERQATELLQQFGYWQPSAIRN